MKRIENVKIFRSKSPRSGTKKKLAETLTLFEKVLKCDIEYIAIPMTSSERRKYIPIDYISPKSAEKDVGELTKHYSRQ